MHENLDIHALSQMTGISVRTIRYYLAEKLLPASVGRGPAASYGPGHRDRLRLIRRLQEAHQPLAAIRERLEALDDASVATALVGPSAVQEVHPVIELHVRRPLARADQRRLDALLEQAERLFGAEP